MSETTTLLKVGTTDLVLRMIEAGVLIRDLTLENPIRAIREISHDMTGRRKVRLANGRESQRAGDPARVPRGRGLRRPAGLRPEHRAVLELWGRALEAVEPVTWSRSSGRSTGPQVSLIERYRAKHDLPLSRRGSPSSTWRTTTSAATAACTTCWRARPVDRVATTSVFGAKSVPPQTTRARLRGEFIRRAQEKRRDFTVDWVHLKLNDQAQRTVLCKDPFRAVDERVEKLIARM